MNIPEDRRYTDQHEWILLEDGKARIGITDYAQDALGDVVFVDLPSEGDQVEAGDTIAEVESTKSVAEVYAPLAGTISAVNVALADSPETINADPYGEGWFVVIDAADPAAVDAMLDHSGYRDLIA